MGKDSWIAVQLAATLDLFEELPNWLKHQAALEEAYIAEIYRRKNEMYDSERNPLNSELHS